MKVVELMRPDVRTIGVKDMLVDAMVALRDAGVSALPVLDESWKPIAVVTNQDVIAASLKGRNNDCGRGPDQIPIPEVMSPWPPVVDPETPVADAARMMSYLDMKRVFVVDQDRVVGVLSQTDIVDALATARLEATGWAENRSDP